MRSKRNSLKFCGTRFYKNFDQGDDILPRELQLMCFTTIQWKHLQIAISVKTLEVLLLFC